MSKSNDTLTKPVPGRRCIGCGLTRTKEKLVRIVRTAPGILELDPSGKKNGRGAYLCRNTQCLEQALKKHAFSRSFRETISSECIESIAQEWRSLGD